MILGLHAIRLRIRLDFRSQILKQALLSLRHLTLRQLTYDIKIKVLITIQRPNDGPKTKRALGINAEVNVRKP